MARSQARIHAKSRAKSQQVPSAEELAELGRSGGLRMADIARLAGVSPATVSRTLANPDTVTEDKRLRVQEVVRSTGYKPHIAARSLRAQRTHMVLVVIPTIANPVYPEVLRGIDQALTAAGYGFIICDLDNSRAKEAHYVDLVFAGQVDAAILINGRLPENNGRRITGANVPLAALCATIPEADIPQVACDDRGAARLVVEHLAGLGHRRIGFIGGRPGSVDNDRYRGFLDGIAAAGIAQADTVRWEGDYTFRAGTAAAEAFLALPDRPTAVFASNDAMAIAFMDVVQHAGLRVPADVSVVGFDGIAVSAFASPRLTTVRQPLLEIGRQGAELLLQALEGNPPRPAVRRLAPELILRESTAAPRP